MLIKLINRILGQAARVSTLEPERLPALPRTIHRNRCRWLSAPMWRPPVNPHRPAAGATPGNSLPNMSHDMKQHPADMNRRRA